MSSLFVITAYKYTAYLLLCCSSLAELVFGRSFNLQRSEQPSLNALVVDDRMLVAITDCATRCLELAGECDYVAVDVLTGRCLFFDRNSVLLYSPSNQELLYKVSQMISSTVSQTSVIYHIL